MPKSTVRSHYLPQTYLRHFLLDDKLEMYKKGKNFFKEGISSADRIFTVTGEGGLRNVGLQNHFYDPEIEGYTSDDFEALFREFGEDSHNELIAKIEALPIGSTVPKEIKDALAKFMAAMRVRTPQFKWETEDMKTAWFKHDMTRTYERMTPQEIVEKMREINGEEISLERAAKVKEMIVEQKFDMKYPNAHFLAAMLMTLEMHADIFRQMTINIVKSPRYFVTSDNPVVFFVPADKVNFYNSARSLVSPHSELFFPITKNIGAAFNWRKMDEKVISGDRELVDIFNYNISYHSFDFIFSPLKLKSLEIFTQEHIPYPFKMVVH